MSDPVYATPVLDLAGKISIAFVFSGLFPELEKTSTSLDLDRLRAALDRDASLHNLRDAYRRPLDAFIRDICDPNTAGMHFPLIMQLPFAPGAAADAVEIRFPETFEYSAESRDVRVERIKRTASCRFRESFALFDTGRFYYSICFLHDKDAPDPLDEYGVLQLLQIAEPTYLMRDVRAEIRFAFNGGQGANLLEQVNARLEAAARTSGNCLHDVVRNLAGVTPPKFTDWDAALSHCLVQIDDPALLKLAQTTSAAVDARGGRLESYAPQCTPALGKILGHGNEELPPEMRQRVALAGLCQNVCDFPYQDSSEVEDSLHPVFSDDYVSFYFHRRIFLVISAASRSLAAAKSLTGICPYVFTVCLLIRFDEQLLDMATDAIQQTAYIKEVPNGLGAIRVRPFDRLFRSLETITNPLSGTSERDFRNMMKNNLQLLRDFHFRFLANPFRYQTEIEMFNRAVELRSIKRRYGDINDLIERHSQRIDEIQKIGDSRAGKWLNQILLMFAVVQAVVLFRDLATGRDLWVPIAVGVVLLFFVPLLAYPILRSVLRDLASRWRKRQ